MTGARFVLSLDCEGKWGVADRLTPAVHTALTDERLRAAYAGILAALDEYGIAATFAFVGTFSLAPHQLDALRPQLAAHARDVPGYLEPALDDLDAGTGQGWSGDWALEAVARARTRHEIGLHGGTHVPFDWPGMTPSVARRELAMFADIGAPLLHRATTFIHPRNRVAHLDVLDEFGIAGYRAARTAASRVRGLASEFNVLSRPDADSAPSRPVAVPAGYFVNYLSGPRRLVPAAVSRARARQLLRRAARTGEVVHYWTHPENIAAAPATLDLLRGILAEVARLRDAGRCAVLTQEQYCRSRDPRLVAEADRRRDARLAASGRPVRLDRSQPEQ